MKVKSLSRVRLLVTSRTAAYQAPPYMGFSRQEYWSGVPLPSASQEHWQPSNSMSNNRLQGFEIEHKGFLLRFEEACHSRINLAECHLSPSVCMACFQGEQVPVQCSCACFRSAGTDGAFTRQLQKELAGGIGTRHMGLLPDSCRRSWLEG